MHLEVQDLTGVYRQALRQGDFAGYFAAYPALFRHYYRFWADPGDVATLTDDEVAARARLLTAGLPDIAYVFTRFGFTDRVSVVLFVGAGTANGHAFWDPERAAFVVWLPVEAYTTPLQVMVFVTHEILHALHYARQPAFYFHDEAQRVQVGRQILTEGLATWGTQALLGCDEPTALWADYMPADAVRAWYTRCRVRQGEMARRVLAEWSAAPATNDWFSLWDPNDVTRYRGGYFVAARAAAEVHRVTGLALSDLLALDPVTLEGHMRAALSRLAGAP